MSEELWSIAHDVRQIREELADYMVNKGGDIEVYIDVDVKRLPHSKGLPLPHYKHDGDAGMDVAAAIPEPWNISAGDMVLVPTGFAVALPKGWQFEVRSKSGKTWGKRLVVANAPGTIDAGYRNEIRIIAMNVGPGPITIEPGEEIAQLVLQRAPRARLIERESLDDNTSRGMGGFGSTGDGVRR